MTRLYLPRQVTRRPSPSKVVAAARFHDRRGRRSLAPRRRRCAPFFDVTTARRLTKISPEALLLSRPETLDRIGAAPVSGAKVFVLQRAAEREVGADQDDRLAASAPTAAASAASQGSPICSAAWRIASTSTCVRLTYGVVAVDQDLDGQVEVLAVDAQRKEGPAAATVGEPVPDAGRQPGRVGAPGQGAVGADGGQAVERLTVRPED